MITFQTDSFLTFKNLLINLLYFNIMGAFVILIIYVSFAKDVCQA